MLVWNTLQVQEGTFKSSGQDFESSYKNSTGFQHQGRYMLIKGYMLIKRPCSLLQLVKISYPYPCIMHCVMCIWSFIFCITATCCIRNGESWELVLTRCTCTPCTRTGTGTSCTVHTAHCTRTGTGMGGRLYWTRAEEADVSLSRKSGVGRKRR